MAAAEDGFARTPLGAGFCGLDDLLETAGAGHMRPLFWGTAMASQLKSRDVMRKLIELLGQLDNPGRAKAEALMLSLRGRANPQGAIVAARAKLRAPATGQ